MLEVHGRCAEKGNNGMAKRTPSKPKETEGMRERTDGERREEQRCLGDGLRRRIGVSDGDSDGTGCAGEGWKGERPVEGCEKEQCKIKPMREGRGRGQQVLIICCE